MPRLSGTDIPEHKKVLYSLQSIYGVGKSVAQQLCTQAKVDPDKRARDLSNDEVARLQRLLDDLLVEGDLRRQIRDNIDQLKRDKSYRGLRHIMQLPARGQRTRTNSRTVRGNKRQTIGAMTKEMAQKLEAAKTGK